jgi:hypothetical protein
MIEEQDHAMDSISANLTTLAQAGLVGQKHNEWVSYVSDKLDILRSCIHVVQRMRLDDLERNVEFGPQA